MLNHSFRLVALFACTFVALFLPESLRAQTPNPAPTEAKPPSNLRPLNVIPGQSSRELKQAAIANLPLTRLTPAANQRITSIVEHPTLYRHLPSQHLDCDPDLFLFVARAPEVLVGIWEVMGITQVKCERLDDFRLKAQDGSGTTCVIDLIYGDRNLQIYIADGYYDGKLVASKVNGRGVFILRTTYQSRPDEPTSVQGSLDCFVQLENLGADLIARTFGPLIGKTADNNFAETARFIEQINLTVRQNPLGMADLAANLPQVTEANRRRFRAEIEAAFTRYQSLLESNPQLRSAERASDVLTK